MSGAKWCGSRDSGFRPTAQCLRQSGAKPGRDLGVQDRFYIHCDGALFGMMMPFIKRAPMVSFKKPIGSVSVSGHKFVGAPVPCGVVMTRMRCVMALSSEVEYLNSRDATIMGESRPWRCPPARRIDRSMPPPVSGPRASSQRCSVRGRLRLCPLQCPCDRPSTRREPQRARGHLPVVQPDEEGLRRLQEGRREVHAPRSLPQGDAAEGRNQGHAQ